MSKLLSMMMSSNGGGSGTLNAEIVGTPTISDDFILSNFDDSNYLKFVPTSPNGKSYSFKTKFRVGDLTKKGCLFMCQPDQSAFKLSYGEDGSGQSGMSVLLVNNDGTQWANVRNESDYRLANVYTVANQWLWAKVDVINQNNGIYNVSISTDGTNYTVIKEGTIFWLSNMGFDFPQLSYEQVGTGDSNNTIEIDLKETKYYIDDVLSWEAVSF